MSSKILYLYDNLLDSATLTASSEATGFPANNLKNPFRTKVWRTEGATPGVATLVIDHGSAKIVDAIALTGYTWATAPGRLVVEFNDSNSWDTPAAVETLTWHSPTTPGGNKGSIILKLSTARMYRYNRLRVASQSVTLAAATTGGTISVSDNDNIDPGTGNFTLVVRTSLPDWITGSTERLMYKTSGASPNIYGYRMDILPTGYIQVTLFRNSAGTTFTSTAIPNLTNGATHEICVVITRETATAAGSVVFYVDGVQLGTSVAITAAATVTLSNSGALSIMGIATYRTGGTIEFAAIFNRALSAADVLSLYQNGIAYADKWGAQTELLTTAQKQFDSGWTAAGESTVSGGVGRVYSSVGDYSLISPTGFSLTVGKRYRVSYTVVAAISGNLINSIGTLVWPIAVGANVIEFVATEVVLTFKRAVASGVTDITLDDISVVEVGATMALEPEGIKTADWQDSSNNDCDGAYPAAGCTVNGAADWDLGRLFLGEYFEPTHNYSWGYEEGIVDPSLISSTIGGQDHADEIEHYRTVMSSGVMSAQSQWVDYQMMINTVGVRKPLWIAFDYDSEAEERTIYGKFTTPPAITRPYLFNWSFEFKEDR